MIVGVRRQAKDSNGAAAAKSPELTLHMLRWLCSTLLPRRDRVTLAWRTYLTILLSTSAVFAAPSRVGFGGQEYSCMPQHPSTTGAAPLRWNEALQNSMPYARDLVSIPTTNACEGQVSPAGTANLTGVASSILLMNVSNCAFSTFRDLQDDVTKQLQYADQVNAAGVILVLREPGQLPPVLPKGTVVLPTCIMEATVGGELRAAMGSSDRGIIDVTNLGDLSLTTASAVTSNNFTALQIKGDAELNGAIPAWPALFNVPPLDSSGIVRNRPRTVVAVEWIDGCLLPTGGTAGGMYARCASDCWSQANPFKNDLSGRIALFDFETVYRKGQELCYSEYWQMTYKAHFNGGAAAVLFTGRDAAKVPVTAGPRDIAADFTTTPAFSLLTKHGSMLAQLVAGDTRVQVTLPMALPNGGGYPPFHDRNETAEDTATLYFVGTGLNGAVSSNCTVGEPPFGKRSLSLSGETQAVFGKALGACQPPDGLGCSLNTTFSEPTGKALILYSQDWTYFSAWSDFVDLATEAGAAALLVVNPGETVYTLQDHGNYTASIPMWNMDYKCGAAMSYLVAQGPLNITVGIQDQTSSGSAAEVKTLTDPANRPANAATSVRVGSNREQAKQALFNPDFATLSADARALQYPAACTNDRTQGGVDCSACSPSVALMDAAAMSSVAGQTWVALLPADTANCLLPHQSLVDKLQRDNNASGVVFYPSSPASAVQLSSYVAGGILSTIPAVLLPEAPASTLSSQAVTINGVNNSEARCLPGFSFCNEEDPTLTSVVTYSADPYAIDDTPTQVLPAAALDEGGAANSSSGSSGGGGGVNVAAIVVPVVLGVVLLAVIAALATYLIKSRRSAAPALAKQPSARGLRSWMSFRSSNSSFKTFEDPANQGTSEVSPA